MLVILGLPPNVEVAKLLKKRCVCWEELCILASRKDLAKVFGCMWCNSLLWLRSITAKSVVSQVIFFIHDRSRFQSFQFPFFSIADTHFSTVALWAMSMWLSVHARVGILLDYTTQRLPLLFIKRWDWTDNSSSSGTGLTRASTWRNPENVLYTPGHEPHDSARQKWSLAFRVFPEQNSDFGGGAALLFFLVGARQHSKIWIQHSKNACMNDSSMHSDQYASQTTKKTLNF